MVRHSLRKEFARRSGFAKNSTYSKKPIKSIMYTDSKTIDSMINFLFSLNNFKNKLRYFNNMMEALTKMTWKC